MLDIGGRNGEEGRRDCGGKNGERGGEVEGMRVVWGEFWWGKMRPP